MSTVVLAFVSLLPACGSTQNTAARPSEAPNVRTIASAPPPAPVKDSTCSADHWCVVSGLPKQVTFSAVWGASANDIWIAGESGTLLHWDGSTWTEVPSGTQSALRALSGTSAKDVWAAGLDGVLLHFDGSSWSSTQKSGAPWSPATGPNERPIYTVFAAPNALWAGGSGIRSFDGAKWSEPHHGSHLPTMSVWGSDAKNLWAVGLQGTVYRWEGHHWARAGNDMGPNFFAIWGSAPNDIWIVGSAGAIVHWGGETHATVASGTTNDLHAVLGFSSNDVWAAGDQGAILHWQGSAWASSASPSKLGLLGIWGASAKDIWLVGENGVVLRRKL
ncbi:MAG TPA: hypothetical protein VFQ35_09330 [Polyangiaceae bacterium]|nr:hypothetical protein [Polyangiaceae bacterium]